MVFRQVAGFLLLTISVWGTQTQVLSPEKQAYFQQRQEEIDAGYEKLRDEWITPVTLKGAGTIDQSGGGAAYLLSAGIAQDLFRSGGITYAIQYAEAKKRSDTISLNKDTAGIYQQLIRAVLNYRKYTLLLEQSELKLKNSRIEIFLKRKQYEAGDIDITLLNNALMNQSHELKNNASIRYLQAQHRYEAAKVSDRSIESIDLPVFALTQKEEFVDDEWNLLYSRALGESAAQQYGQIKSSYLPKLTLIADAGIRRYSQNGTSSSNSQDFYDAGLQLSLPLTYNASAALQEAQAAYLRQQAQSADTRRQNEARYEQSIAQIESYRHIIAITGENLKYYDELISATKAAVDAGYKAGYDLQTLQNTKAIEELEIKINEIDIQIELATLHTMIHHPQEKPL